VYILIVIFFQEYGGGSK